MSEARPLTCGDNSCLLDKPTGQGTNGGCRCINSRMTTMEILRVKKHIWNQNKRIAEQEQRLCRQAEWIAELKDERDEMVVVGNMEGLI